MGRFLLPIVLLASVFPVAAQTTLKLNDALYQPRVGNLQPLVGAAGDHLVYFGDQLGQGRVEIFGVPLDASASPVRLNPTLTSGQRVGRSVALSQDGTRTAFLVSRAIWSAPTDGSSPAVQLTPPIDMEDMDNFALQLTPDGSQVVYREDETALALHSVPSDGSLPPVVLHSGSHTTTFVISPDSQRVVFFAAGGDRTLFSVPVDGSASPVALSPALPSGELISTYAFSPDGARIVYLAEQDTNGTLELYSVPSDGSASPVKLNAPFSGGGQVGFHPHFFDTHDFVITGDGTRVVYVADPTPGKVELHSVPIDGSAAPVTLSGSLPASGDVSFFDVAPDGRHAAFLADLASDDVVELWLARLSGEGAPVRLNDALVAGGDVKELALSSDSRFVAYRADQRQDERFELFSAPIGKLRRAGDPGSVRLSPAPIPGGDVLSFFIDAGAHRVVFAGNLGSLASTSVYSAPIAGGPVTALDTPAPDIGYPQPAPNGFALLHATPPDDGGNVFSVPIDGSLPAQRLNDPLPLGPVLGEVRSEFQVTPDGSQTIYTAALDAVGRFDLYSVATDGSAAPQQLNPTLVANGSVSSPTGPAAVLSPDGTRVAYVAKQDSAQRTELYVVPTAGGAATKLHALATNGASVSGGMLFTPDSSRVVHRADEVPGKNELYSVLASGAASPVRLNGNLVTGGDVEADFALSANGARVVYRADEGVDERFELFSAPADGSTARVRLHPTLLATRDVTAFAIDPTSQRVVFLADLNTDEVFELYSAPIASSSATKLNDALVAGGDVLDFRISPDGSSVVYRADQAADERFELYSVPIDHSTTAVKLNPVLATGGDVGQFGGAEYEISANSTRVVYVADQDLDQRFELYSVPLDGSAAAVKLNGPLVANGDVTTDSPVGTPHYFAISADSTRVVYIANQDQVGFRQVYSRPIDGSGSPAPVSDVPAGRTACELALEGTDVFWVAHPSASQVDRELLRAPIDASALPQVLVALPATVVRFRPLAGLPRVLHVTAAGGATELFTTLY